MTTSGSRIEIQPSPSPCSARREPQRLDGADDGIAQHLRHGLPPETRAALRRLVGEHRDMHRRNLEPFELEPRVKSMLVAAVALERVGIGALERRPHGIPPLGVLHQNEAPRLAIADRRRVARKLDRGLHERGIDRIGPEAPHIAAPQHQLAELRPRTRVRIQEAHRKRDLPSRRPVDQMEERAGDGAAPRAALGHRRPECIRGLDQRLVRARKHRCIMELVPVHLRAGFA